jgi:hypothetical protein
MLRTIQLSLFILLINYSAIAQGGYVKLYETGETLVGFIRFVQPVGQDRELEIWTGRNDERPARVSLEEVSEYSMGKDTVRIIRNFQPFPSKDIFFDMAEAKILVSGPIELLKISNPYYKRPAGLGYSSGGIGVGIIIDKKTNQQTILALHERRNGYIRAVNEKRNTGATGIEKNKLIREVLEDFFPASAIAEYEANNKSLNERNLKRFMKDYKAKRLR